MAWEQFKSSRRNMFLPAALSIVWIALVLAGARLTSFNEPYLPFAIGGALVFFLRSAPSRWEIYAWLMTSGLLVKVIHLPQVPFWVLRIAAASALLGFGAILLLGLRAVWSQQQARENAIAHLAPALILILFIFGSARALQFSSSFSPETRDAWLYAFDGSLGFQPSFAVGRIMYNSLLLTCSALLTYLSLPFAMATVCAWRVPAGSRKIQWHMLIVLLFAGVGGWLLYNVIPGTGPIYAFARDFPWTVPYQDLSVFTLAKMQIPTSIPRNAMPSLHVGWLILLCWNSRGFPRALRAALLLYLILTVIATLGSGQHYFVDLVVSVPFALTVQAAAAFAHPNRPRRLAAFLTGITLTLSWLAMVRFGTALAIKSPAIPWTMIAATLAISLWLDSRMSEQLATSAAPEAQVDLVATLAR